MIFSAVLFVVTPVFPSRRSIGSILITCERRFSYFCSFLKKKKFITYLLTIALSSSFCGEDFIFIPEVVFCGVFLVIV